jgi:hypothetical protein
MNTKEKFKFTVESLLKFDTIFEYYETAKEGLWLYKNPFAAKHPTRYANPFFFVQVGGGHVLYIDGWCPDGMEFDEIVEKLKKY